MPYYPLPITHYLPTDGGKSHLPFLPFRACEPDGFCGYQIRSSQNKSYPFHIALEIPTLKPLESNPQTLSEAQRPQRKEGERKGTRSAPQSTHIERQPIPPTKPPTTMKTKTKAKAMAKGRARGRSKPADALRRHSQLPPTVPLPRSDADRHWRWH